MNRGTLSQTRASESTADPRMGATLTERGTRFALWSTRAQTAAVRLYATPLEPIRTVPLVRRGGALFEAHVDGVGAGALYKLVLDGDEVPDPYGRFFPAG